MNLTLTPEEVDVRQAAREFADGLLAPRAAEIDKAHAIPDDIIRKLAELGFLGMLAPEPYGGAGMSNLALALVQIEVNRACASTGVTMSVHNSLFQSPILRFGNEEQKKRYLPPATRGDWLGAYSLTEPGSGTDAAALRTTARKEGDHYVLNGTKNFVTNGGFAKHFIVYARSNPDPAAKHNGISAFFVDRAAPGFSVGAPEHKMGIRGSSTTTLTLDNVKVPAADRLGAEGEGFKIAMSTLDGGRVGIAAQAVGIAQACLDASVKYAKERKQFGRPIADFQAIQWKLAEMATELDAATLLIYRAARLRDAGQPHAKEASMAKLFASTIANKAANEAVQIHGGAGYCRDFPVERYFRDAKITEIYEGTSEAQRMIIAKALLK
jgi:alkylation response protein AidB-like acyl-CoA dehydrogenase